MRRLIPLAVVNGAGVGGRNARALTRNTRRYVGEEIGYITVVRLSPRVSNARGPLMGQSRILRADTEPNAHSVALHTCTYPSTSESGDAYLLPFESGTLGVASKLVLQAIVSPKLCHKGIASRSDSS